MEKLKLVQLGGDLTPLMSWVGAALVVILFVVALVAMALWVLPPLRKGDTRMVGTALTACLALPGVPAVFLYSLVWTTVYEVEIETTGNWVMTNALGGEVGRIDGNRLRRLSTEPWDEQWDGGPISQLKDTDPVGVFVEDVDGVKWTFVPKDIPAVLTELGYAADSPCNLVSVAQGWVFDDHRFTDRGPACSKRKIEKKITKVPSAKKSKWKIGDHLLVIWAADGWWYPATAISHEEGRVKVRYADGSEMVRSDSSIRARQFSDDSQAEVNWEGKGYYYNAEIVPAGDGFEATYDDGSRENVDWSRIRIRFPKG